MKIRNDKRKQSKETKKATAIVTVKLSPLIIIMIP